MANRLQLVGYLAIAVIGISSLASLLAPSLVSVGTWVWVTAGIMGLGLVLSVMWTGTRPRLPAARLLFDRDHQGPQNGA